jgi:ABC-type multidrug transport system ATPase subunit
VLADEPTGELDSATSERLIGTLRELNRERGVTIIVVTHDAGVAGATDRVVRLHDGRVVADARRSSRDFAGTLAGDTADGRPARGGTGRVWVRLGELIGGARGR